MLFDVGRFEKVFIVSYFFFIGGYILIIVYGFSYVVFIKFFEI